MRVDFPPDPGAGADDQLGYRPFFGDFYQQQLLIQRAGIWDNKV